MDADPVTTLTIAVLFGGGSGGLVSWWIKGVIDRSWKDRARELDAKVAAQVKETEQLRAHSLGLEAERRRNFEAKRAEAAAGLFGAFVELRGRLRMAEHAIYTFMDTPIAGQHLSQLEKDGTLSFAEVEACTRGAALYLSVEGRAAAQRAFEVGLDLRLGNGARLQDFDTAVEALRDVLRGELMATATSPESSVPSSDGTEEGTPPSPKPPSPQPGSSPSDGTVEPG